MKKTEQQQILILDSPDGTGKTNIAQGLCARLDLPYFRCNKQHSFFKEEGAFKKALTYGDTLMVDFIEQTKVSVVLDRAYPAEWVYSRVYRRETNLSLLDSLDRAFSDMGAWIIIPVRHDYSNARDDEVIEKPFLPLIHDEYVNKFRYWTMCNTITVYVDAYGDDLNAELDAIVPELRFESPDAKYIVELDGMNSNTTMFGRSKKTKGETW